MKTKFNLIIYLSIQLFIIYLFYNKYHYLSDEILIEKKSVNSSINFLENIFNRQMLFVGGSNNSGLEIIESFLKSLDKVKISNFGAKTAIDFMDYAKKIHRKKIGFIKNAKFKNENIDKAIGLFAYYILSENVLENDYVCSIEERNALHMEFYKSIFPKSKFIYLVRDGREFAYSQMEANKTFDKFLENIQKWNEFNTNAYNICQKIGSLYCFMIKYDQLTANPAYFIEKIAQFLEIDYFNSNRKISFETDQYEEQSFEKIKNYDLNLIKKKFKMLSTLKFI